MPIDNIELVGIQNPPPPEDRILLLIKVYYDADVYDWQIFAPITTSNWAQFLDDNKIKIKQQIDQKEAAWAALNPKTTTITDISGETITVPIQKGDIVKPDIPDYYAKRRQEYPSVGDQLDALWKGVGSPEYNAMIGKIQSVKDKYSKA